MVGFSLLFAPWSRIACSVSRASFFVFHESFLASAKMVVPFNKLSISTRGNRSSNGSPPEVLPLLEPPAGAMLTTSAEVRVGSGAGVPSTLSNSPRMVVSN